MTSTDSVLLVDWLNLSIKLKSHGREFGPTVAKVLLQVARRESDELSLRLTKAHFVAENFGQGVERELERDLSTSIHRTRTAKEQADLKLAVLAMDYVHQAGGSPQLFILATGDQDFVPIIERIIDAKSEVVLIAGALSDLAPEYRAIVAQHDVRLIGLVEDEEIPLLPVSKDADEKATGIASLLRLVFDGGILGGNQSQNASKISSWRVGKAAIDSEQRLVAWIREFTSAEMRRVAVPGTGATGNQAQNRRRVSIDLTDAAAGTVIRDMDWILRRCDATRGSVSRGDLGVGRFADDNGSRVGAAVAALVSIGWIVERPDRALENAFPWGADGFLEPLIRLLAVVQAASYNAGSQGVSREKIFRELTSVPIAASSSRKGGQVAAQLIDFGRRIGVIDTYPANGGGSILGVVPQNAVVRQLSDAVRQLKSIMPKGEWLAEHALLSAVREADRTLADPTFGFDAKDRRSIIRPLTRANLLIRKTVDGESHYRLRDTAWVKLS